MKRADKPMFEGADIVALNDAYRLARMPRSRRTRPEAAHFGRASIGCAGSRDAAPDDSRLSAVPDEPASNPELSVVVPTYNEAGNVGEFLRRLVPILEASVSSYEIIFAADPCKDGTEKIILDERARNPSVKLLRFSRRFGQPTATLAGIECSSGDAVVVMDADLQDPPEVLTQMIEKWRDGYDVVYGQRRSRTGEPLIKRTIAKIGYAAINRFADVPIPRDAGDFRLLDRRVVDQLNRFGETHGFLRGLIALVGFEQVAVEFDRPPRHSGETNYNRFTGSLRIGFNGIVAFSSALLNLSTVIGFVFAVVAFVTGTAYVIAKFAGVTSRSATRQSSRWCC